LHDNYLLYNSRSHSAPQQTHIIVDMVVADYTVPLKSGHIFIL